MSYLLKRANSAPQNPLAGFEGPLRLEAGQKRGKEKGEEKEMKERAEGKGENTPEIDFWLPAGSS